MSPNVAIGEPLIVADSLRKRYESTVAVDGVDLTVYAGEIFGILGPNGAGKTTTLEMMEGLREPDDGTITIAGFDTRTNTRAIQQIIGVQLQSTALFDYLTAIELLRLFGHLYRIPDAQNTTDRLLQMVGLEDKRDSTVSQLSGGQQQRLSVALGLVNSPVVAFLDEPTTGLDPGARRTMWDTIRGIRDAGTTVVLTTHYMEEAETLCDRVAIMDSGRIIALDTPESLVLALDAATTIQATVVAEQFDARAIEQLSGVVASSASEGNIKIQSTDAQATIVGLLDLSNRSGWQLSQLRTRVPTLEDVFLSQTGRTFQPDNDDEDEAAPRKPRRSFRRSRGS